MGSSFRLKLATIVALILVVGLALFGTMRFTTHAASTTITLSVSSGPPTTFVKMTGSGFGSKENVVIMFDATSVDTRTTYNNGAFFVQFTIPSSVLPGNHTVLATGQTSGLSAQATFLVQTNWAMSGFDSQHTLYNPYENVLNPSNVFGLTLDWSHQEVNSHYASSIAVANGIIYVSPTSDKIIALNAQTGAPVWSYSNTGYLFTPPAVVNGIVYAGSADGKLYALGAQTGSFLWSYTTGGIISSSPTVANGVVFVGSGDGNLYALAAQTGSFLWSYTTGSSHFTSPAVANGVVYVGSDKLYALNATTGALIWSNSIYVQYPPAVANGIVFVSTFGTLSAFGALAGTLKWKYGVNEGMTAPAVANGVVYVNTFHKLVALTVQGGKLLWMFRKGYFNSEWVKHPSSAPPAVANGVVYVDIRNTNSDWLFAVDATKGNQLWRFMKNEYHDAFPVVANGILYVGSDKVYAFDVPGAI